MTKSSRPGGNKITLKNTYTGPDMGCILDDERLVKMRLSGLSWAL
jgi:hypothetical protein